MKGDVENNSNEMKQFKPTNISELIANCDKAKYLKGSIGEFEKWKKIIGTVENNIKRLSGELEICNNLIKKSKNDGFDISERQKKKKEIQKEIEELQKKYKNCAKTEFASPNFMIIGPHGIGKTTTINVILNDLKYKIINFSSIETKNIVGKGKWEETFMNNLVNPRNILDSIMNKKCRKRVALVIDELETIESKKDKIFIHDILKINRDKWYCPIIIISNSSHIKFQKKINQKNCKRMYFNKPTLSQMIDTMDIICQQNNMKISHISAKKKIVEYSQYDIRRLSYLLEGLFLCFKGKNITLKSVEKYIKNTQKKDEYLTLGSVINKLLSSQNSIEECLIFHSGEKVFLPTTIHQNYHKTLLINYDRDEDKFDMLEKVSESMSRGDIIENYIFGRQFWDLQDLHGYYSCAAPSFYLTQNLEKYTKIPIEFSKDLNKFSTKSINNKNKTTIDNNFKNCGIEDYLHINNILKHFVKTGNFAKCREIIDKYGLTVELFDKILKIDRIDYDPKFFTTKQKKMLKI